MTRQYTSRLREQQADATRLRVIEAVAAVLARDIIELTYPAVAEEAGVSVATVQRLFPTKHALVEGLANHYSSMIGSLGGGQRAPKNLDEFLASIPEVLVRTSRIPAGLRAAAASEAFRQHRREHREQFRLRPVEHILKPYRDRLTVSELHHLRDLVVVLCSSAGLNAFTDLAGSTPEGAASSIQWLISRVLQLNGQADRRAGGRSAASRQNKRRLQSI